jgi:hypothetical protein
MNKPPAALPPCCAVFVLFFLLSMPVLSWGHGVAGKRFFPATLAVDDPFISDELSIVENYVKEPDQGTNQVSLAYSKRITENFGLEFGAAHLTVTPNGEKTQNGFANIELGAKYQFFTNDPHETILSIGLGAEIGSTGSSSVGADSFSTISPGFFFGKGFGDLPEPAKYLRPFAITGAFGPGFPTRSNTVTSIVDPDTGAIFQDTVQNPALFNWGFTVQYSLQYLQSYVKDVGLGAPLNRTILVVEFPLQTCMNRGCGGQTTGYVNPGVIWFGKSIELGLEAQIPINSQTGNHVGVLFMVHFFLDDLFPNSLGRPIFK